MSIISNRHNISKFVSGESKPLTGQRLAKVGYKLTEKMKKEGKTCPESICVSVPPINGEDIQTHINALIPHISEYISEVQDKIIRGLYEGSDYSLSSVSDEEISVSACIAYLESESSGGRWTKEYLTDWFTRNVEDNLSVVIAEKLGFQEPTEQQWNIVYGHTKAYAELISSLSGGKTELNFEQINGVRRAIEVSSVDDDTSQKLIKRLDVMEKKLNERKQNMLFAL